jgi:hypothetical protein
MRIALVTLFLVCGIAEASFAAPILYSFTGTLTGNAPATETNDALRALTAGDHFTGSFWYSFSEPPVSEGSPTSGIYIPGAIFSLAYELQFETLTVSGQGGTAGPATAPVVRIGNSTTTTDTFTLSDEIPQSPVGNRLDAVQFALSFSNDTFADRSMPATLLPGAFLSGAFRMTVLSNPCPACYDLVGRIDTLEARSVPEPPAILLSGLGLAAAFFAARSRRLRASTVRRSVQ